MPGPARSAPHLLAALVEGEHELDARRSVRVEFGDGNAQRDRLRELEASDFERIADAAARSARRRRLLDQQSRTLPLGLE